MYENMVINDWPTYIMLSDQLTDQLTLDKHTLTLGGLKLWKYCYLKPAAAMQTWLHNEVIKYNSFLN